MRLLSFKNTVLLFLVLILSCGYKTDSKSVPTQDNQLPIIGASQTQKYLPLLQNKRVGVVANQTSGIPNEKPLNITYSITPEEDSIVQARTQQTHLIDSLISLDINIVSVFAPEHGFRGKADAGELVKDGTDIQTGLPIISLHGKNKKPTAQQLQDIDILVFDIQDVGVRFYTYISTMHLVMEAAAENNVPVLILDRPNPNGHYVDGPTMLAEHTSFLGKHPVPLVHGMTIGEYAQMINGQGWLANSIRCNITVIPVLNYTHSTPYSIPVRPSPNLPNDAAINLYPSLGLLEGTTLNAGRGTEMQFQILGDPNLSPKDFPTPYRPQPNFGSKYPKHQGVVCNGLYLAKTPKLNQVDLQWIIKAYNSHSNKAAFFNTQNFTTHAGTPILQQQIESGMSAQDIRATWQLEIEGFKKIRAKYLIYSE